MMRTLGRCKQHYGIGDVGFDITSLTKGAGGGGAASLAPMLLTAVPVVGPILGPLATLAPGLKLPGLPTGKKPAYKTASLPALSWEYYAKQSPGDRVTWRKYWQAIPEAIADWAGIRYAKVLPLQKNEWGKSIYNECDKLTADEVKQVTAAWSQAGSPKTYTATYKTFNRDTGESSPITMITTIKTGGPLGVIATGTGTGAGAGAQPITAPAAAAQAAAAGQRPTGKSNIALYAALGLGGALVLFLLLKKKK
jgi:hypothetical protein